MNNKSTVSVSDEDEYVYLCIKKAIFSGLVKPGEKLQEPTIARILDVSRERVRKALHRLAHEKWLDIVPNKGSYIPVPSIEELHAIYAARKILELGITKQLAEYSHIYDLKQLTDHIAAEKAARESNDRAQVFKLSADFHFLLVHLMENHFLTDMHQSLMQRSSLHFSLYAPANLHDKTTHYCAGPHEHEDIVNALISGDAKQAEDLMQKHLSELEILLSMRKPNTHFLSIEDAFQTIIDKEKLDNH